METDKLSEGTSGRFFSMFERQGYYKSDNIYLNAGAPGTELLRMLPPIIEAATSYQMLELVSKNQLLSYILEEYVHLSVCVMGAGKSVSESSRDQLELEGDAQLFQYGEERGNWQFRSFLATFLSEEYAEPVDCEKLFLTGGASTGLWLILSCFFSPGAVVFIEDPSYFVALKIFMDFKMKIVPVKTDQDGLLIEDLEEKFQQHIQSGWKSPLQALLYIIPVYHNPTGYTLPKDRCQKLVSLSRRYGVTVVCDDVYNLLHYDDAMERPSRLFALDDESDPDYVGNVISNASFSKILGPGLRIGWMEAPKWAVQKLENFGILKSGGGLNTFTSGIITSMFALGKMTTHLEKVRNIYKTHMEAAAGLLREELPPDCRLKSPAKGGYFLWIELPETMDAGELLLFTKAEYQISFTPGSSTSPSGSFQNYLRICISFYPLNVLLSSVRKLCQAIADFQTRAEKDPTFRQTYQ